MQSSDGPRLERGPVLNYSGRITINSGIDRPVAMQPGSATDCDRRHPPPCSNRRVGLYFTPFTWLGSHVLRDRKHVF